MSGKKVYFRFQPPGNSNWNEFTIRIVPGNRADAINELIINCIGATNHDLIDLVDSQGCKLFIDENLPENTPADPYIINLLKRKYKIIIYYTRVIKSYFQIYTGLLKQVLGGPKRFSFRTYLNTWY